MATLRFSIPQQNRESITGSRSVTMLTFIPKVLLPMLTTTTGRWGRVFLWSRRSYSCRYAREYKQAGRLQVLKPLVFLLISAARVYRRKFPILIGLKDPVKT